MSFEREEFLIGANYWASHAGTAMWTDWKPEEIEKDFALLSNSGIQTLRIFPLWPDFQPLVQLRSGNGEFVEYRFGEEPLPDTAAGKCGLNEEMLDRFGIVCELAKKYDLKLIVGLITGWMSGRLFVPPAFADRNPITDAETIKWQVRFVRGFIEHTWFHHAILAWDLGNECNVMGACTAAESYVWLSSVANAIRSADPSRKIVSGMHSLKANSNLAWSIAEHGELVDVLTTHPYPLWTEHTDRDSVPSYRTLLHSSVESRFYQDLSGKVCLLEELGTMGPDFAREKETADFFRKTLCLAWADNLEGVQWWCAFDQDHLKHAPYAWVPVERNLGMNDSARNPKPMVAEIAKFRQLQALAGFQVLPSKQVNAVCITNFGHDPWGIAFNASCLAATTGLSLTYTFGRQNIPEAPVYLLPDLSGTRPVDPEILALLVAKVKDGATLYLSINDGLLGDLEPITGVRVVRRRKVDETVCWRMLNDEKLFHCHLRTEFFLEATSATALAETKDQPVIFINSLGKGKVVTSYLPLESTLLGSTDPFESGDLTGGQALYRTLVPPGFAQQFANLTNGTAFFTIHEYRVDLGDIHIVTMVSPNENGLQIPEYVGEWKRLPIAPTNTYNSEGKPTLDDVAVVRYGRS